MFKSESEMSLYFEKYIKTNFGNTYFKEYSGLFGIPDFVLYTKSDENIGIISIELKLKNWRRAIKQAFKYRSFSHISYVVLDKNSLTSAVHNIDYFKKYNIGLAAFNSESGLEILHKPEFSEPFSEQQNLKLIQSISSHRKRRKGTKVLSSYF